MSDIEAFTLMSCIYCVVFDRTKQYKCLALLVHIPLLFAPDPSTRDHHLIAGLIASGTHNSWLLHLTQNKALLKMAWTHQLYWKSARPWLKCWFVSLCHICMKSENKAHGIMLCTQFVQNVFLRLHLSYGLYWLQDGIVKLFHILFSD